MHKEEHQNHHYIDLFCHVNILITFIYDFILSKLSFKTKIKRKFKDCFEFKEKSDFYKIIYNYDTSITKLPHFGFNFLKIL